MYSHATGTLVFDYPTTNAISRFITLQLQPAQSDLTDAMDLEPEGDESADKGQQLSPRFQVQHRAETGYELGHLPDSFSAGMHTPCIAITAAASRSPCDAVTVTRITAVDAIHTVPHARWSVSQQERISRNVLPPRFGGFLDSVDLFDAAAFGISSPEASLMDPQQRLLLEATHQVLATTALQPSSTSLVSAAKLAHGSSVGVFVGVSSSDYNKLGLKYGGGAVSAFTSTGASLSVMSGRVSFIFGLRGPSLSIDTACSSSLVSLHAAINTLTLGQCAAALNAGVNLMLTPDTPAAFQKAGMLAPDGRCKTLDVAADGYVRAEALGVLLLMAVAGGRAGSGTGNAQGGVLAWVDGSAVNQDGRSSALTAPNGPAQQEVMAAALVAAGMEAGGSGLSMLQMHGTGGKLIPLLFVAFPVCCSDRLEIKSLIQSCVEYKLFTQVYKFGLPCLSAPLACVILFELPRSTGFQQQDIHHKLHLLNLFDGLNGRD